MKANRKYIIRLLGIILSCLIIVVFTACTSNSSNSSKSTDDIISDSTSNQPQDTTDSNNSATEPPADSTTDSTEPSKSGTTKSPGLEWGFLPENWYYGCIASRSERLAYRSDINEFDIDNVKLTIYFGGPYGPYLQEIEDFRSRGYDIPEFEISCVNYVSHERYLIKKYEENFVSEEYTITEIYNESHKRIEIVFNHSEEITIPKEVFYGSQGRIWLELKGSNVVYNERGDMCEAAIMYEVVGSKVILSPKS